MLNVSGTGMLVLLYAEGTSLDLVMVTPVASLGSTVNTSHMTDIQAVTHKTTSLINTTSIIEGL